MKSENQDSPVKDAEKGRPLATNYKGSIVPLIQTNEVQLANSNTDKEIV